MPKALTTKNRITELDGKKPVQKSTQEKATIEAPDYKQVVIEIVGTSPYVQHRFGSRAIKKMRDKQAEGSTAQSRKKREPRDFDKDYEDAQHVSNEGWFGIPAPALRSAMLSACRTCGFVMTRAKLGFWIIADGIDRADGMPLTKMTKGKPHKVEHTVRNETGVTDIRARPMFDPGWEAKITVEFDATMFKPVDILNLLHRAGVQVGIGEGRNDSKKSAGVGWGSFEIVQ